MNWIKRILKWPATPLNNRLPLYKSVWRVLWMGPIVACIALSCLFIACGHGWEAAVDHWKGAM